MKRFLARNPFNSLQHRYFFFLVIYFVALAVIMKIGCLQFAPVKGDVHHNLSRADAVLLKENPEHLDLLVLPKLAFTGKFEGLASPA